jgi:hypothetical protein
MKTSRYITKRPFFLFVALCVATVCALAQKVTKADFEQVGKQVRIMYQLDKTTDIQVLLSTDGGKTFGSPLRAVTGDAGKNVTAGNKTIVWSPLEEMEKLVSDNVVFKIVPVVQSFQGGRLPGKFSVSSGKQVQFSRGNLQYQASTKTWRFAEHQWDIIGMGFGQTDKSNDCYIGGTVANSDNRQIGSSYSGWIDLFGWGTGNAPTKSSDYTGDYSTFVDWGTNPISNDGNQANMWRTLTNDEWNYLFSGRANASSKYGVGMVNGINGMIVLPDEFTLPSGLTFTAGVASSKGYQYYQTKNNYTAAEWARMESCGALFLPAAGSRYGSSVIYVGYYGFYWSSTPIDTSYAYCRYFYSYDTYWGSSSRYYGRSVRLVR